MEAARSRILDIFCASCGAPAEFDIARQVYTCQYCGSETGIRAALEEKKRFRRIERAGREQTPRFRMETASCKSCGAHVVFAENEALSKCAFCGKSLVRKEYLKTDEFPELLIPFRVTPAQARERLLAWCAENSRRPEAKSIQKHIDDLQGCYLPHQLVKGPTRCTLKREDTHRSYECRGWIDGMFVNTSQNLNNLLLNGVEPYDLSELRDFDFAFVAGQRVRIADLTGEEEAKRVSYEIAAEYEPTVFRTMETKKVYVRPETQDLLSMSAVLPAYYLRAGLTLAAVNGQTGKVAVQEQKMRRLFPWWIMPILVTLLLSALSVFGFWYFSRDWAVAGYFGGMLSLFFTLVVFTAYHNQYAGTPRWKLRQRILTSDGSRVGLSPPVFYETLEGVPQPVRLRFTSLLRSLRNVLLTAVVTALPLAVAFVWNGFSAAGLTVGGAAVWLCITVPVAPIYLLKFGRLELYEHPMIYVQKPDGRWRRYFKKPDLQKTVKKVPWAGILIGGAVALGLLAINVYLILHWDEI